MSPSLTKEPAGHSGPRALDCAKQINIARTGFIRIEKALLLSQVSMTDRDSSLLPHPESSSVPSYSKQPQHLWVVRQMSHKAMFPPVFNYFRD